MQMTENMDSTDVIDVRNAPSLVPERRAIDCIHLSQIAGGEERTMREVLKAFDMQAVLLLDRIASETPKAAAARAHTLADSARAVGAWRVAELAEAFEGEALKTGPIALSVATRRLSAAVTEVQLEIQNLTRVS
jgi:HPt (histidine-containing phosphotransfer) domain-containing protein